ncbi:SDR family oxidoreductase [Dokdonella sp.]|uniref:SDR family oxidoreductase n=1 Tax=Dokdonella sp. TaxID=2291710 RepID=UPI0035290CDF
MSIQDFSGKVAVITGAGSGFGHEFARLGAELGMSLVLADVQAEALQAVSSELESGGARVLNQVLDVSDAAQVDALAEATQRTFGEVHLLFNNAGVGTAGLIWENSVADWQWTLGVNLWGVVHGMRAFVPRMLASAKASPDYQGHVVNTASMAGLLNPPASGVYNVSKSAVVSLSESLHHDLSLVTTQVHCSVLCPFYVPTGINTSQRNRPAQLANAEPLTRSQRVAQAAMDKAVHSGKISAADVARMTFEAVREGRFYIASHPKALEGVRQRAEDIVAMRNPTDPLAAKPGLREAMIKALHE